MSTLDERLRHAADEAHRVAGTFARPAIEQSHTRFLSRRAVRYVVATIAVGALLGVGWAVMTTFQADERPVASEGGIRIHDDPPVIQAPEGVAPRFDLPQLAVGIPLQPMLSFLPGDGSYIQSFIADADTTVAIGEIDDGQHRVFLVTGPAVAGLTDGALDGSRVTCIIDTAGNSGSCLKGDVAVSFGLGGGWGTDDGLDFRVLRGTVPHATSVIVVTTPQGSFWQAPRGGVGFLALPVSSDEAFDWQFLDAEGVVLGSGAHSLDGG